MRQPVPRVVVVSSYPVLRAGLESLLRAGPEQVRVVDRVAPLDEGAPVPDLAIVDLHALPDCEDDLHALAATCPVVGLEPEATPELAERARALGVTMLLPLSVSREQLILACRQILTGAGGDQGLDGDHGLSARELQIIALIAAGRTNGEIAEQLYLSINSVKSYIRSAYGKLGINRRSHAVKWAIEQGLVER